MAYNKVGPGLRSDEVTQTTGEAATQSSGSVTPSSTKTLQISVISTTSDSVTVMMKNAGESSSISGSSFFFKPESASEWLSGGVLQSKANQHKIDGLKCDHPYQIYAKTQNGQKSAILNVRTKGSKPIPAGNNQFVETASHSAFLKLRAWNDGGCEISHFQVDYKKKTQLNWSMVSDRIMSGINFALLDLEPATKYMLRVTAHNSAGSTVSEYEFSTLTFAGKKLA